MRLPSAGQCHSPPHRNDGSRASAGEDGGALAMRDSSVAMASESSRPPRSHDKMPSLVVISSPHRGHRIQGRYALKQPALACALIGRSGRLILQRIAPDFFVCAPAGSTPGRADRRISRIEAGGWHGRDVMSELQRLCTSWDSFQTLKDSAGSIFIAARPRFPHLARFEGSRSGGPCGGKVQPVRMSSTVPSSDIQRRSRIGFIDSPNLSWPRRKARMSE
jgi:hypothetical protein